MSETSNENAKSSGKGRPTPSRKEREAANRRPLVGDRTKEGRKAANAAAAAKRNEARLGLSAGEERYLGPRDRGPQKRFARDFVDSRFTVGEMMIPVLFFAVILTTINNNALQIAVLVLMWGMFLGIFLNGWLLGRKVQKQLSEKYGEGKVERGLTMYVIMRSIQMRPMRLPKPQVKRGTKVG
jgi:hypothetical protein